MITGKRFSWSHCQLRAEQELNLPPSHPGLHRLFTLEAHRISLLHMTPLPFEFLISLSYLLTQSLSLPSPASLPGIYLRPRNGGWKIQISGTRAHMTVQQLQIQAITTEVLHKK